MSSRAVFYNPTQIFPWYILAIILSLAPVTTTFAKNGGGESLPGS